MSTSSTHVRGRAARHRRTARVVRAGLVVFFLLVLFDGALRKWVLPGFQQILFVIKDAVLAATLGFYLLRRGLRLPTTVRRSAFGMWLVLFAWWCALEAFNFRLPNVLLGIWGFKLHVQYASLLILIPAGFSSFDQLWEYVRWYAILAIPILALGITQFYAPPSSFLNTYAHQIGEGENVARFGEEDFARITGTFSYIAGMGRYIFFAPLLALVVILGERFRFSWRLIPLYAVLILGAIVTPMNGSRWPIFAWAIVLAFLVLFAGRLRAVIPETTSLWRVGVLVLGIGVGLSIYGATATDALQGRLEGTGEETQRRVVDRLFQPFQFADIAGLFGYGVGSTYQAAGVLVDKSGQTWGPPVPSEEAPERLMLELGIIGFLLQYGLYAALCVYAYRVISVMNEPRRLALALGAFLFCLVHVTEHVAFNVTAAAFFWGFAGTVVAVAESSRASSSHRPRRSSANG